MARRKSGRDVNGIVLLDKRLGVSSNQALQEARRLFQANRAGHTGSLDPMASGLLPLCFGEATKVSGLLLDGDKRYQVTIRLGVMTDTGDSEGRVIRELPVAAFGADEVRVCLQGFLGESWQTPPMYSALKWQGKKLYELARAGESVERAPRRIVLSRLELLDLQGDLLSLDVACSKGTYIRVLAQDIAERLGCCGMVAALRRTEASGFDLARAHTVDALQAMSESELAACLLPVDAPLGDWPLVEVSPPQGAALRQGQPIELLSAAPGSVRIYCERTFLGLGELLLNGKLAPKKIFHLDNQIL